jgi:hypothetical protein
MTYAYRVGGIAIVMLLCVSACTTAQPPASEADVAAVLESFYGAMKAGDKAESRQLAHPDHSLVLSSALVE